MAIQIESENAPSLLVLQHLSHHTLLGPMPESKKQENMTATYQIQI